MGVTGHNQIGRKLKGSRLNSGDKTSSKGININTDIIEYVPHTLAKNN